MERTEFEEILKRLDEEITEVFYRWSLYKEVFSGDGEKFALLNKCGSNFLYYTRHLMLDQIALSLSKLTDPNRMGKHENLSLKQVHVYASDGNELEFLAEIKGIYEELEISCCKFRELRNKRIAHSDLAHALTIDEQAPEGISVSEVETSLEILSRYMNKVQGHYLNSIVAYSLTNGPLGSGGIRLLSVLEAGIEALEGSD